MVGRSIFLEGEFSLFFLSFLWPAKTHHWIYVCNLEFYFSQQLCPVPRGTEISPIKKFFFCSFLPQIVDKSVNFNVIGKNNSGIYLLYCMVPLRTKTHFLAYSILFSFQIYILTKQNT